MEGIGGDDGLLLTLNRAPAYYNKAANERSTPTRIRTCFEGDFILFPFFLFIYFFCLNLYVFLGT